MNRLGHSILWRVSRKYRADMVLARVAGAEWYMRVIWAERAELVAGYLAMLLAVGGFIVAYMLAG